MMPETIVLGILGVGLFVYLLIAGVTALQVYSMSKAGLEPDPTAPEPPAVPSRWAADNEFGFLGKYRMKTPMTQALIYAWQRTDRPTYFCTYIVQSSQETKESYDLVTIFGDDVGLTTGNSSSRRSADRWIMSAGYRCGFCAPRSGFLSAAVNGTTSVSKSNIGNNSLSFLKILELPNLKF